MVTNKMADYLISPMCFMKLDWFAMLQAIPFWIGKIRCNWRNQFCLLVGVIWCMCNLETQEQSIWYRLWSRYFWTNMQIPCGCRHKLISFAMYFGCDGVFTFDNWMFQLWRWLNFYVKTQKHGVLPRAC